MIFDKKSMVAAVLGLLLAGCSAQQAFERGKDYFQQGKVEEGLVQMDKAAKLDPDNYEYRSQYYKHLQAAIFQWLLQAEDAKERAEWETAKQLYHRVLGVDPQNTRAKLGLKNLDEDKSHVSMLHEAKALLDKGKINEASSKVREVLTDSPSNQAALKLKHEIEAKSSQDSKAVVVFKSKLARPITIEFKDAPIHAVFDAISKVAGVNFLFDKDVRPDIRSSLLVRDARIEDVIRFLLVSNQLRDRVLNGNTLFVYPNTPDKLRDFQELQIKNFYLTNARAKDVAEILKGMVKPKDIYVDDSLNLIIMRDTLDVIQVAERLIAAQDIAEPEVMLEVEVLEVGTSLLDNIGVQFPSQISYSLVGSAGTAGTVTRTDLNGGTSGLIQMSISNPGLVINMLHQDSQTNILTNPKIRVKNHEQAVVRIGDKLPVINNTTTATGLVSQNVSYLDVGLKLEVLPSIYLNDDVGIKMGLEVSNVVQQIPSTNGTVAYQIGTRNADTILRLKNGETQILAGLIENSDQQSAAAVPGLGQFPILGRLFSNHSKKGTKTEVVLLITPHVIRNVVPPEAPIEEFSSGTASLLSLDKLEINQADSSEKPSSPLSAAPAEIKPGDTTKQIFHQTEPPLLGNVQMSLEGSPQVKIGSPFTVQINVTANGLQNALLNLAFNPEELKVVSVSEGDVLSKADGKTQFMQQVQEKVGQINLGIIRKGNVDGEGVLASITFEPLKALSGSTQIHVVAANFSDEAGRMLPINSLPSVNVGISK